MNNQETIKNLLVLYRCETPLHIGSGNEMGVVDLPIQREKHTGFPKMEASGLKGGFRAFFEQKNVEKVNEVLEQEKALSKKSNSKIIETFFGSENESEDAKAGGLIFTDGRLLLFPIRAGIDVFRWITCPYVLQRFSRELERYGKNNEAGYIDAILNGIDYEQLSNGTVYQITKEKVKQNEKQTEDISITLGHFSFETKKLEIEQAKNFISILEIVCNKDDYLSQKIQKNIVLVSDELFSYFTEMNTQMDTRICIGDNGVVKDGGLFTEESLPEESILYSFIDEWKTKEKKVNYSAVKNFYSEVKTRNLQWLQLGGDTTIGKGIVRIEFYGINDNNGNNNIEIE